MAKRELAPEDTRPAYMRNDHKPTGKRNKAQMERDYELEASLYLQGKTLKEIAEIVSNRDGPDCDYTLSYVTISNDLRKIRGKWLESALLDMDKIKAEELAKIDRLEREYWEAWHASLAPEQMTQTKEKTDDVETTSRTRTQSGDARYLQGIQWCINRRIELFGLDAPKRTESYERVETVSMNLDLEGMSVTELNQLEQLLTKALPGSGEEPPGGDRADSSTEGAEESDRVYEGHVLEVSG